MKAKDIVIVYLKIWCVIAIPTAFICWIIKTDFIRFVEILFGVAIVLVGFCFGSCFLYVDLDLDRNKDVVVDEQTENGKTESQQTKPKKRKMDKPRIEENSQGNSQNRKHKSSKKQ